MTVDGVPLNIFLELDNVSYSGKVAKVTGLFTKEQNIEWSILCAKSVLHIYEAQYPSNTAPRLALDAARQYLRAPTKDAAANAANAAAGAAYAAYAAGAAYAAYAAYAAANAANAANAAVYAANASYAAANAAASRELQEKLNLSFMLQVYKDPIANYKGKLVGGTLA